MRYNISPSQLSGTTRIPSSKSHTLRAILCGALANGTSRIEQYLHSPDTEAMIFATRQLGAEIKQNEKSLEISGVAGKVRAPEKPIECGNSGQVLRFIGAVSGLIQGTTILTGDASIRTLRPVTPLLEGLTHLGAKAFSLLGNGYAPITVQGPFTKDIAYLDGKDSQPVSGLLIASAFAPHPIQIHVTDPGEEGWIELTLDWLKRLDVVYERRGYTWYKVEGGATINSFNYSVPGDWSSAAFPIGAALITGSEVTIENLDITDSQSDKVILSILERMGAKFSYDSSYKKLHVLKSPSLQGLDVDLNQCIDALPLLAVLGCYAKTQTKLYNGSIARKKESDRITSIAQELSKMGARIEELPDGLIIQPQTLHGAHLTSHDDHRIALALSVAALGATTKSSLDNVSCIAKSYPNFRQAFHNLGALIDE